MSMGGMAAIQLALLAPGLPAVAIGARRPSDVSRLFSDAAPPPAFEPVCACLPRTARDALLFVYATDHDVDRVEAEEAAALSGGRCWACL